MSHHCRGYDRFRPRPGPRNDISATLKSPRAAALRIFSAVGLAMEVEAPNEEPLLEHDAADVSRRESEPASRSGAMGK